MTKVLVLYYSSYGHIEAMADAVAAGAASVPGTAVTVKRVPELVPDEVARGAGMKTDQQAPIATPDELADYDAIIFGTPTRFGNMAAQMRNFLDQTGGLWFAKALVGKVGSVFVSTASSACQPSCQSSRKSSRGPASSVTPSTVSPCHETADSPITAA